MSLEDAWYQADLFVAEMNVDCHGDSSECSCMNLFREDKENIQKYLFSLNLSQHNSILFDKTKSTPKIIYLSNKKAKAYLYYLLRLFLPEL